MPASLSPEEPGSNLSGIGPGLEIPGYEVLGELGRGGMGVVYKARQKDLKRLVALKMIRAGQASSEERARFKAEAEAVARLHHPNIVQIYDVGEYQGQPYFSLEFVEGGSLDRVLKGQPQDPRQAALMVELLARAMHAAHQANVIHRDLKPANILLSGEGRGARGERSQQIPQRPSSLLDSPLATRRSPLIPKITDFGLAKHLDADDSPTRSGAVMGTPSYMAPEQAAGQTNLFGPWTDVHALGAILYEMLTGRPPFQGQSLLATLEQVQSQEPVPPRRLQPRCPRDLETICLKALHKKPRSRYHTAEELAQDLHSWLDDRPIRARPVGSVERLLKWVRRSPIKATAGLMTLVLLVVLFAFQVRALNEKNRQASVRTRFEAQFARAERARENGQWTEVERAARGALDLIADDPSFADFALREPAQRLLERAEGALADAATRTAARRRLDQLREHHSDAVFFTTLFTGLELASSFERVQKAAREGLAQFGVTPEGTGRPQVERRFFDEAERQLIASLCHELLLLEAEVLAQPRVGEQSSQWKARLRQALDRLARAEGLGPETRVLHLRRADYLEQLGEIELARRTRQQASQVPQVLPADLFLAGLDHYRDHARRGEAQALEEASQLLARVLRLQPGHYGARYLLAVCRVQERRWQEARVNLTACLDQRPGFVWPHLLRAYAAMQLGSPAELAEAEADLALVLNAPPDPMARYVALVNHSVLAVKRRQWRQAITDLEHAIVLRPESYPAYLNLAIVRRSQVERPAWLEALLPGNAGPGAALSLAALSQEKRQAWRLAIQDLDRGIARRPDVASLYHERGRIHQLLGQGPQAREDLVRAIALAPAATTTLAGDLLSLGRLLHDGKQFASAVDAYDAVLKVRPDQSAAHALRADSLLELGRYDEAAVSLDRYLSHAPLTTSRRTAEDTRRLSRAYRARGVLHGNVNDQRSALACYTHALQLEKDPRTLTLRGWAYLLSGAPLLALHDFNESLQLRPGDPDSLVGRADARVKLGHLKEALADVEEGLRRGPASARLLFNSARVHAQAAGRLAERAQANRERSSEGERLQERAVELIRSALLAVPAAERARFWREYVQADSALNPIRRCAAMARLEAGLGLSPR